MSDNRINRQILGVESVDLPDKFYSVDQGH